MATEIHYSPLATITLKGKVPSKKNSKRRVQRGASVFMIPSAAHEAWHEGAILEARTQRPADAPLQKVDTVHLTFWHGDQRANDLSNKAESVMDLLVDAGILADDNWNVVPTLVLQFAGLDKENPRVVVQFY